MSRRSAHLDFSIRGDEQEYQRMLLERNLQATDLSLHLSSTPDEDSDVEYPRHASVHSPPFSAFASFDHRSGDDFDPHEQSRFHAWSYHTEDGGQPYAAQSLSTAAHHASALTISAGLGGGRGPRRDISLSGAEYDPERPLQGIMAGIAGRFSGFDANSTKSKQITASMVYDPLIVDDTAELDRVLQSGHAPARTICSARSSSPSSSSDSTGPVSPPQQQDSRLRLADALSHMTFSPKRPRNAQALPSPRVVNAALKTSTPDRSALSRHLPRSSSPNPFPASTPRPQRRFNQSLSYAQDNISHSPADPEVNILPATPSTKQSSCEQHESSRFATMARGLAREIEVEAEAAMKRNGRQAATDGTPKAYYHSTIAAKPKRQRSPLRERMNQKPERLPHAATPFKKSVQLPDVTGLTSAIASPAKADMEFYGYDPKDATHAEARLITTLSVVHNKLAFLEQENSVSRRRIRELEHELEACKKEVLRERTKIMELEQSIRDDEPTVGGRRAANQRERLQQQQKQKAEEGQAALADAEKRLKNAVEEEKALEALIATLRAHLTRLTAELSGQNELLTQLTAEVSGHNKVLTELRSLRDADARTLAEKSKEVDKLKQKVEDLTGEVIVLRGIVEEGLKERQSFQEQSASHEQENGTESAEESVEEDESEEELELEPASGQSKASGQPQRIRSRPPSVHSEASAEEEGEEEESVSRRSPTPSPRRHLGVGVEDKTMHTNYATVASSQDPSLSTNVPKPILNNEEVSRIASERSARLHSQDDTRSLSGSASPEHSRSWSRDPQPNLSRRVSRAGSPSMMLDVPSGSAVPQVATAQLEYSVRFAGEPGQAESSRPASPHPNVTQAAAPAPSRHIAPTSAAASSNTHSQKRRAHTAPQPEYDTPFPQIRGAHLERLFYSAPDHNVETCTVCHRKGSRPDEVGRTSSWPREREHERARRYRPHEQEGEGPAEGPGNAHERRAYPAKGARDREDNSLPPQTVLVRVLRELEDDFTHFKGIYIELADQYKEMDPVSNVVKRNVLADHLHEVIDILEQKGNQIASLYDLLTFKDKPVSESVVPDKYTSRSATTIGAQGWAHVRRYPTS